MIYNFSIQEISKSRIYSINIESPEHYILGHLTSYDWTSQKIKKLIESIKLTRDSSEEYRWQNEDLLIVSNKHGVFFIDLISMRGNTIKEKQDLDLNHDTFIQFLEAFEKFVSKK